MNLWLFLPVLWQAGHTTHFRRKVRTCPFQTPALWVNIPGPLPRTPFSPSLLFYWVDFIFLLQGLQSIQHGHLLVQANPVLSNTRCITQQSQRNNLIQACCKASPSKLPKQNNNTNILALWQHWLSGNNLFIARQTSSLAGNFAGASGGFEKVGIRRFGSPEMCSSPCACHVRGLQWKSITLNATQLTFYTATWQADSICRNSLLVFFF